MAKIYDYETSEVITVGLQGCETCDEAFRTAKRIADDRGHPVILIDDDGAWTVYPKIDGQRRVEETYEQDSD